MIIERDKLNYPSIAIVGDFGGGKTLLLTFFGLIYHSQEKMNIFANYDLFGVDFRKVTFQEVSKMPDWLKDGVLLLDEVQVGADSYNFFAQDVKQITQFITQIRKRNIILIVTSQRLNFIAKRIRQLINFYIEVRAMNKKGLIEVKTFDVAEGLKLNSVKYLNLKSIYKFYNTNEVVSNIRTKDVDSDYLVEEELDE